MGLLNALIDIASTPLRCVDNLVDDLTSDDEDSLLAITTLGLSSATKGVVDSVAKALEDLED
ncbi:MAG: hypothetical protein J6Q39_04170 [Bacteroidales bacterium]|nr:hypothetical protein [Bacteroidales bacterium]